jgi:glucose-1-phosphate adenylyltransferase
MNNVLGIILGGGQGSRLFPLTATRAKPAVPIGGKYRLIDVPISNCLHAELRRIFVLTQFNSASLNRHVAMSYHMDPFSRGFVDIIAAEQTPDNPHWFQGTADAVRQASRHFAGYDAKFYLILAGDHLYRLDYGRLLDTHIERHADITIAAKPVTQEDATAMGLFRFDGQGQIIAFEEKPSLERLGQIGSSMPPGTPFAAQADTTKPFVASMGIYVFTREVLLGILENSGGTDFGREIIPAALAHHKVAAYLYDGYWADVGTVESFYDANIMLTQPGAPFSFYDPVRPIFTHQRFLPPARFRSCVAENSIVAEGCNLEDCHVRDSVIGIRTSVGRGTQITRSVILGSDFYPNPSDEPGFGIGRDVILDRVIIDKDAHIGDGARLVNEGNLQKADGDGYYIRGGIIVVPKGGRIEAGRAI